MSDMPQVHVTIAGKSYRMACGDGEEEHLQGLARMLDARIDQMRVQFGEIGDMRLQVMAALTMADEIAERRKRIEALEKQINDMKAAASATEEESAHTDQRMADFLLHTCERIESLARTLSGPAGR